MLEFNTETDMSNSENLEDFNTETDMSNSEMSEDEKCPHFDW